MEEEKHKFIIPIHERRQPGTVTIDPNSVPSQPQHQPTTPLPNHEAQSPIDSSPRIQQIESFTSYPPGAHLRGDDIPDASPPYPESRISSEAPVVTPAPVPARGQSHHHRVPAPALAPADPERQQGGTLATWKQRFDGIGGRGPQQHPRKTILGLTVLRFWAAVALGVIIVGVAIAVGLALGLANRVLLFAKFSPSDENEPKAVIQQLGVPSPAPINPYCPLATAGVNTTVTPYDASGSPIRFNNDEVMSFDVLCNTYYPMRQGINPYLRDILVMTVPDMLTCMTLCAQYNQGYSDAVGDDVFLDGGGICVGVALVKGTAQFCHLQNATGINQTTASGGFDVDSAVLSGQWASLTSVEQIRTFGGNIDDVIGANATTTTTAAATATTG
ncbi:membrane insertase protein [Colletotrichum scovillei]|uniref:Membrane insertase protein n=1 Tax=Colletotrichum scovillei TaxID=1209932 RepID=A0A9P7QX65_9PEZI|nr:membrane insertase protein [Colletotrichum scovillei]KAG7049555.1 membrane insertase protein [Colletotrichum scovillei]KAG7064296.1 membrane insertase protein [Colletotrichum scovillei]